MRFFGKIGFEITEETMPGVWEPKIQYREYFGDVVRNQRRWSDQNDNINDKLTLTNEISVVADDYILENLGRMRCVEFGGFKWKVSSITIQSPRVNLTLSELYTEEE